MRLELLKKDNKAGSMCQANLNLGFIHKNVSYAILLLIIFFSCSQNPSSWYPSGSATVISYYETTGDDETILTATIEVQNKGITNIHSCSVSIAATTDMHTYRQTISKLVDILPGGRIYEDSVIVYNKATERLKSDGLAVINEFYY